MTDFPRVRVRVLRVGSCRHPEAIALRGGSLRPVEFPALVGLIEHPTRGAFVFDTGYAAPFLRATRAFPGCLYRWITPVELPPAEELTLQLARLGLAPERVSGVLASHFHADHVSGLGAFPGARVWCSTSGLAHVRSLGRWSGLRRGFLPELLPADLDARTRDVESAPLRALPGRWALLGAGHDLLEDGSLWAVPLPGHARAQFGLLVRDECDAEVLFAADAAWSRRALLEQRLPAWPVRGLVDDWGAYALTLATLGALLRADGELVIVPSHCLATWRDLPPRLRVEA